MAQEKQWEYRNSMQKELDEITQKYLRPLQKQLYLCSAACCDNVRSQSDVSRCLGKCAEPFNSAQQFVASEYGNFQGRFQRCIVECNDVATDKLGLNPTESEVEAQSKVFETCANGCLDKHMGLIPNFNRKVHEVLKKKAKGEISSDKIKGEMAYDV